MPLNINTKLDELSARFKQLLNDMHHSYQHPKQCRDAYYLNGGPWFIENDTKCNIIMTNWINLFNAITGTEFTGDEPVILT